MSKVNRHRANIPGSAQGPGKDKGILIQQTTLLQNVRTSIDIKDWRDAIRSAESLTNPNRSKLYDIYYEALLDSHLSSVLEKRKAAFLNSKIVFMRNGEEDEAINKQIRSPWFRNFLNDLLDTIAWGGSLMQFYKEGEWINYDLIPRKNSKFELGIVTKYQGEITGVKYRENPEFPNVLEVIYNSCPLGIIMKAAQYVIYKRNCMADYAQYTEIFGQPIREGIYDGFDPEARDKLNKDLTGMGSSSVIIHAEGTKVNLIEGKNSNNSNQLYTALMRFCNEEISKLVLSNTLTTQQGENGARALGDVHQESEKLVTESDRQFALDVLNFEMTDIFENLGLNVTGGEFIVKESDTIDLDKRILVDMKVADKVPIDPDYWYNTYGITKPKNFDAALAEMKLEKQQNANQLAASSTVDTKTKPDNILNKAFSFFH